MRQRGVNICPEKYRSGVKNPLPPHTTPPAAIVEGGEFPSPSPPILRFPPVFSAATKDFVRDENLALQTRLFSACFEHLHFLEGFEQALIDLVTEPEACRALFETTVDFYIELFDRKYAAFPYDWVFYNDDWGTARAPFFSVDTLRETILTPTIRIQH